MEPSQARHKLIKTAADLAEFFDNVQISASYQHPEGGTVGVHGGCGDFFARRALAQDFIETNRDEDIARAIQKHAKREQE